MYVGTTLGCDLSKTSITDYHTLIIMDNTVNDKSYVKKFCGSFVLSKCRTCVVHASKVLKKAIAQSIHNENFYDSLKIYEIFLTHHFCHLQYTA